MRTGELEIEQDTRAGSCTLALRGELDVASAPRLELEIARLCEEEGASEVCLDLADLTFLDSTGFRAILASREICEAHGCAFVMSRPSEPVARLFDVSGLLRRLPFRQA